MKISIKNELCPLIWEGMRLNSEVRENLFQISTDFYKKTELKSPIRDIYLMGSLASYNWNEDSDIDVHIVIDFNDLQMPIETAIKTVKSFSSQWNEQHKIIIKGHKVELNIQSIMDKKLYVNGIYSIMNNKWVRVPKKSFPVINKNTVIKKYKDLKSYIENAIHTKDREFMKQVKEFLASYRQYGLDTGGELSKENIVFKLLRNKEILKKLSDAIVQSYDTEFSIAEKIIKEINQKQLKSTMPKLGIDSYDIPWKKLTLDNLKALKEKARRFLSRGLENNPEDYEFYKKIDDEIKKRLQYINNPVEEGYGAGIPEEDPKIPKGKRWTVRFDSSSKILKETYYTEVGHNIGDYIWGYSKEDGDFKVSKSVSYIDTHSDQKWFRNDPRKWNFTGRYDVNMDVITVINMDSYRNHLGSELVSELPKPLIQRLKFEFGDNAKIKRFYEENLNEDVTQEMPQINLTGKEVTAGGHPLKGLKLEDIENNIVFLRNDKESFFPAGYTLVYFMDSEEAAQDLKNGKIPYLMIPRGSFYSGGSPITDVWKKKYQKPGTEHILGLIEGNTNENEIFIDMISVRPKYHRNKISTFMIKLLKKNYPNAKLTTSSQTEKGEKFFKSITENTECYEKGDCFGNVFKWIKLHQNDEETLVVHGKVRIKEKIFDHAWIEKSGKVIDPTTRTKMDKDFWYDLTNAIPLAYYTPEQALTNIVRNKNMGPWTDTEVQDRYVKRNKYNI